MRRLAFVLVVTALAAGCDTGRIGGPLRLGACGDGVCAGNEDCGSCAADCGACDACGDGTCDTNESCTACPEDCGMCGPCGDMICEGTETCGTCADDCGACGMCGDGTCDSNEGCDTCNLDCGVCGPMCGDGTCDAGETCDSCNLDCGVCPTCGDGTCNGDENCETCTSDCGACTWPPELAATEDALLVLMNELRAKGATCGGQTYGAVPPLAMHEALREAARLHSQDMGEQNYFDHTSLDGRSPWQRIRDAGYPGSGAAENIAAGNNSAQATFNQWLTSPGHCRNMMTANANEVGIGHAEVPGSRYRHYWTQAFGRR